MKRFSAVLVNHSR